MLKLIKAVKRLFIKDKFYSFLFNTTGVYPKDIELYKLAFRHKSASIHLPLNKKLNNERLEFLGDAILSAVIATICYQKFPEQKEGFLTKLRSKLVSRKSLNELAEKIQLHSHIISNVTHSANIGGNTLEALIGAVYLDHGYMPTFRFIDQLFSLHSNIAEGLHIDKNYKSKLLEWAQKYKQPIFFNTEEISDKTGFSFRTRLLLNDEIIGKGEGSSKKEAQQNAAKEGLKHVKKCLKNTNLQQ